MKEKAYTYSINDECYLKYERNEKSNYDCYKLARNSKWDFMGEYSKWEQKTWEETFTGWNERILTEEEFLLEQVK